MGLCALTNADPNRWETNGPSGARIETMAIHPMNNHFLFAGTIEGGLYKSQDGGLSWQHVDDPILEITTRVIKFYPTAPDTVFLTTARGIFRSNDCGLSWSRLDLPYADDNDYANFAISPFNPQIMMAGSWGYIVKSVDGGNYWDLLSVPYYFEDMEFDPFDSNTVYAATHAAATGRLVIKSTDLGVTWQVIGGNLDSISYSTDLEVDPHRPNHLYLTRSVQGYARGRCVSKTTNGGAYWIDITPADMTRGFAFGITVSRLDVNTIYLCTFWDGIFRSRDGGITWVRLNQGLYGDMFSRVVEDTISGMIYLGTFYDGIYRSTDGGDSWERISRGIFNAECTDIAVNNRNPDSVYVSTYAGLHFSSDGCQTWRLIDPRPVGFYVVPSCLAIDKFHPEVVFVGYSGYDSLGRGGIMKSTDGGVTWYSSSAGLPVNCAAVELEAVYDDTSLQYLILAAQRGIFISDRHGDNWVELPNQFPVNFLIYSFEVSEVDDDLMFVCLYNSQGVPFGYRSRDGGQTWEPLTNYPSGGRPEDFVCDPVNENVVYVSWGLDHGIFKSSDIGQSWIDINGNLPRYPGYYRITGIAVNPLNPSNIAVLSCRRGFYITNDGGQTWEALNDGLNIDIVLAKTMFAPNDTSKIYLATRGNSVWTIARTATGIADTQVNRSAVNLRPCVPNPFNSATAIEFSIMRQTPVCLEIFDITGRRIETLIDEIMPAGTYRTIWRPAEARSGIYFCRLQSEEGVRVGKLILLK